MEAFFETGSKHVCAHSTSLDSLLSFCAHRRRRAAFALSHFRSPEKRRKPMHTSRMSWRYCQMGLAIAMVTLLGPTNADLNPAALIYKLPNQIEWKEALPGAME